MLWQEMCSILWYIANKRRKKRDHSWLWLVWESKSSDVIHCYSTVILINVNAKEGSPRCSLYFLDLQKMKLKVWIELETIEEPLIQDNFLPWNSTFSYYNAIGMRHCINRRFTFSFILLPTLSSRYVVMDVWWSSHNCWEIILCHVTL